MRSTRPPRTVMFTLTAVAAAAATVGFTIAPLYRLRTVGMDPLQLVLVGSVMEATVFLAEIPTGIVADALSRRLSIIVGHAGMGLAFVVEASWPTFTGVLVAQALWGLSYTFTSGATTAWLAGELGDPDERALSSLFLRLSRAGSIAGLVSVPVAWLLAGLSLRTPLIVAGGLELGLAAWLVLAMGEARFHPTPREQRSTWGHMAHIGRTGLRAVRMSRVLLLLALFLVVVGGASEAYDRLFEAQLLGPVGFPSWFGWSPLVWFGLLTTTSAVLGIVIPPIVERRRPAATRQRHTRWLMWLTGLQVAGLLVFGLTGAFVLAALASLLIDRVRSVRNDLLASYLVPLTPPGERATVLSAFSQSDAIGQVLIGPVFGVIGRLVSVPAAIVASAFVTMPGLAIIGSAGRARARADEAAASTPA